MRTWDVCSDDMGTAPERMEAPTAEAAAREHVFQHELSDGARVTVRELSGARERRTFTVARIDLAAEAAEAERLEVDGARHRPACY